MKHPIPQIHFWFLSTIAADLIWLTSPAVKAYVKQDTSQTQSSPFPLAEYEARYNVKYFGVTAGESIHRLQRKQDGSYHFESKTKPSVKLLPYQYHESTDFAWEKNQIKPQNYFYDIPEGKRSKRGNVAFDWENKTLGNKVSKEPWEMAIPDNVQDKLTQMLRLRYDLTQNKTNLVYTVAEDDEVKTYSFRILGEEEVKTPLGTFIALKVEHVHRKGHRTNTWFAKKLNYLPIKVNQLRKGRVVGEGEITYLNWTNQEKDVLKKKG